MARQPHQTPSREMVMYAAIAMVIMAVGFFPRMVQAASGKKDLSEMQKTCQQNPSCSPSASPSPGQ